MILTVVVETNSDPLNQSFLMGSVLLHCNRQTLRGIYFFYYHPKSLFDAEEKMDINFVFEPFTIFCRGNCRELLESMSIRHTLIWSYIANPLNDNIQRINKLSGASKTVVHTATLPIEISEQAIIFWLSADLTGG